MRWRALAALALGACGVGFHPSPGRASCTIDLIWADSGTSHVSFDVPSLNSTDPGTLCRTGARSNAGDGRCLLVQLRAAEKFTSAIVGLGWDAATSGIGIGVDFVPELSFGRFGGNGATGMGPTSPAIRNPIDCVPACDTAWGFFGGESVAAVAQGTYIIGSVNFDVSGIFGGLHSVVGFLTPGVGGITDERLDPAPVQLNSATIEWVPEPGSAALLGWACWGSPASVQLATRRQLCAGAARAAPPRYTAAP